MRSVWSGFASAVVLCLCALATAAGEIEPPPVPVTAGPADVEVIDELKPLTPAEVENLQTDLKAAKVTPAEGRKPKPPKPPKPDRRHPVDPVIPEPGPEVHPIQPVGPRPDNNFRPAPPRPQPKPHDGKVIDNLIHNVPTPRPLTHWFWGFVVRAFWLIAGVTVLAVIGIVLLARAALRWFR